MLVEDTGEAIILRTLDQVVARAQALSRTLVHGQTGAAVDDFLAERANEATAERRWPEIAAAVGIDVELIR